MERGLPERDLHRDSARPLASPRRCHRHRGRQLPGSGKRTGNGGPPEEEVTPAAEPAYVAAVLMLYIDLPDTPLRPSPQDQALARSVHQHAVLLPVIEAAFLRASMRRLIRPSDLPPLPRIRSLAYFQPVIAELQQQQLPQGYLDYLRLKFQQAAKTPAERCSKKDVS